jgi:hypothetical protein
VPGTALLYAGISARVIIPVILGSILIGLAAVIVGNVAVMRVRLDSGELSAGSLFVHSQVPIDAITRIQPIKIRYRRTLLIPWNRGARVYEIWTGDRVTEIWLNPNVFGDQPIRDVIGAIGVKPGEETTDRELDVFSLNRDYASRPQPSAHWNPPPPPGPSTTVESK